MDATGTEHLDILVVGFQVLMLIEFDYSNDTATALLKAPLPQIGFDIAAAGNKNFWLFCWWMESNHNSKST